MRVHMQLQQPPMSVEAKMAVFIVGVEDAGLCVVYYDEARLRARRLATVVQCSVSMPSEVIWNEDGRCI
jgi:hypothetical protein